MSLRKEILFVVLAGHDEMEIYFQTKNQDFCYEGNQVSIPSGLDLFWYCVGALHTQPLPLLFHISYKYNSCP